MRNILALLLIFLCSTASSFAIEEEIILQKNTEFQFDFYEPKKIIFKNGILNEISPVLNFRGRYEADIEDSKSNYTYPFVIEGGVELKFDESKNKIRVISNFTRDVDNLDNKFLGKLSDVYFERQIDENHKITIGNSRVAAGLEGSKSSYNLTFPKRAQLGSNLGNSRALGVKFKGENEKFDYIIGAYSSTRYMQDITDGAEFSGLICYKPFHNKEHILEDIKLGAGVDTGVNGNWYTVSSAFMEWRYKKFLLNAEYAYADGSNSKQYNPDKQAGFYTTAVYDLNDKFQLAGRYDVFDYDTKEANDTVKQYSAGLNYFVFKNRLKFNVSYIYTQRPGTDNNSNSVYFATQVML